MALSYDRTQFLAGVADTTKYPNITSQLNTQNMLNRAVRRVLLEVDVRSTKRKATAIALFNNEYEYTSPSDLKDTALVDIIPQKPRKLSRRYSLVSNELFDRTKSLNGGAILHPEFAVGKWMWNMYPLSKLFDADKPISDYTDTELDALLNGKEDVKVSFGEFGSKYEGVVE